MNVHTARSAYHGLITGFTGSAPLAGVGHLLAVGLLDRRLEAVQRAPHRSLPYRSRIWAGNGGSEDDQRHRAVFSGIWQVGRGFQVSGFHYLGTGIRDAGNYGGDLRNTGAAFSGRLRPMGRSCRAMRSSLRRKM